MNGIRTITLAQGVDKISCGGVILQERNQYWPGTFYWTPVPDHYIIRFLIYFWNQITGFLILWMREARNRITASQLAGNKLSSQIMSFYHQSWRSSSFSERLNVCGRNSKMAKRGPGMTERRDTPQSHHLYVESKKWREWTHLWMMDRLRHTEQTHGGPEEGRRGVLGEQMQVLHIEGRSTKALLCSAGRHSQRLVMDHNGQSMEEDCTHVYVKLDPCAAQQKLTQHCKSTVLQSSF